MYPLLILICYSPLTEPLAGRTRPYPFAIGHTGPAGRIGLSVSSQQRKFEKSSHSTGNPSVSAFGAGLPPISTKLIKRIQDGEFIDMSELAIDRLGLPLSDDSTKPVHSRRRPVTSIVEWAQCFSNYIALVAQTQVAQTKLDVQFCSDICSWYTFLTEWNGVSLLRWDDDNWTPEHCIQTDVSRSWDCGVFWDNHWLQWCWPQKWATVILWLRS